MVFVFQFKPTAFDAGMHGGQLRAAGVEQPVGCEQQHVAVVSRYRQFEPAVDLRWCLEKGPRVRSLAKRLVVIAQDVVLALASTWVAFTLRLDGLAWMFAWWTSLVKQLSTSPAS